MKYWCKLYDFPHFFLSHRVDGILIFFRFVHLEFSAAITTTFLYKNQTCSEPSFKYNHYNHHKPKDH